MDRRSQIEREKPVAPSGAERAAKRAAKPLADLIDSDEYRRAAHNPDLIAFAIQARAYRERLRREGRTL